MSQADELLKMRAMVTASMNAETEEHITIGSDRIIRVPESLRKVAVQYDHRIETVTFDCPRYWDKYDMSKMVVYVNYMRADGEVGKCQCDCVRVDEDDDTIIHFDWTITKNVSLYNGPIRFLVCIKKVDSDGNEDTHWNSELNDEMYVSEGLEVDTVIEELYPDVYTQILEKVDFINDKYNVILLRAMDAEAAADSAEESAAIASESEINAKQSELNAKESETNSKQSEINARLSEINAKRSETNAKESETNAEIYCGGAESSTSEALDTLREAREVLSSLEEKISNTSFSLNTETGDLEYESPNYDFSVNHETGNLEWEVKE